MFKIEQIGNKYSNNFANAQNSCEFKSLKDVINEIKTNNKGYHEKFCSDKTYKLFGDIDGKDENLKIGDYLCYLVNYLREDHDIDIELSDIIYSKNEGNSNSYHYVIQKLNTTIIEMRSFHEHINKKFDIDFDLKAYRIDGLFRLPYQSKPEYAQHPYNENSKHIIPDDLYEIDFFIESFLLQHIPDNSVRINVPGRRIVKIKKPTQNKTSNIIDIKEDVNEDKSEILKDDIEGLTKEIKNYYSKEIKTIELFIEKCYKDIRYECNGKYDNWLNIGMALRNHFNYNDGLSLFKKLSEKAKKPDTIDNLKNKFDSFGLSNNDKDGNNIDYLYEIAKEDNTSSFQEIVKANSYYYQTDPSEPECAFLIRIFGEKYFIKHGNNVHSFDGKYWVKNDKNNDNESLYQFIRFTLQPKLNKIYNCIFFPDSTSEKYKNKMREFRRIKGTTFLNDTIARFKNTFIERVMGDCFDLNPNLFGFMNGVYDLEKHEFRDCKYNDYITINCAYAYRQPTLLEVKTLNGIIDKMFSYCDNCTSEELKKEKKLFLEILSTCLSADQPEKFFIFTGCGRNGKGVCNDLLKVLLGKNYGLTGANKLLLDQPKSGPDPELANINRKRAVIFREPTEKKKFQNSIIKELTGGGSISGRALYQSDTEIKLNATIICECNNKPSLSEIPTQAELKRIIIINFNSRFTDKLEELNENEGIYALNPDYKTSQFQEKYKFALFDILKNHYKDFLNRGMKFDIPEHVSKRSEEYVKESNTFIKWLNDNYKKSSDEKSIIKLKDIWDDFKEFRDNDENSFSKFEKRSLKREKLISELKKDDKYKRYFKDNGQYNGQHILEHLVGYEKIKTEDNKNNDKPDSGTILMLNKIHVG